MTIANLARLTVLAALAAVTLSGCIMYVGPHDGWTHRDHHHDDAPAPDEKPADTMPANPA